MNTGPASISVVIPALDEAAALPGTLAAVRAGLPHAEIVVVDGGSGDATPRLAVEAGARLLRGARGRGRQCALGANHARGDLLFFLHADTRPPADAAQVLVRAFSRPEVALGTFRLAFDAPGAALRLCAWFSRFDTVFTRFGDQGIVVRRSFYEQVGGFPPLPLFEDVEFLRRARRLTRVWSFPATVTTSARRFRQRGVLRQQFQNARLLLRFLAGASPDRLAEEYRRPALRATGPAGGVQGTS